MKRLTLLTLSLFLAACSTTPPTTTEKMPATSVITLDWEVTEEEPGEFDQPNFSLALILSGDMNDRIELGTYAGSFADGRELSSLRPENAILMGIFWWAGAGDELIVERPTPGTLTISHRETAEELPEPLEFQVVKTISIPESVTIELAPWRDQ